MTSNIQNKEFLASQPAKHTQVNEWIASIPLDRDMLSFCNCFCQKAAVLPYLAAYGRWRLPLLEFCPFFALSGR
jgi:hypothetical protein